MASLALVDIRYSSILCLLDEARSVDVHALRHVNRRNALLGALSHPWAALCFYDVLAGNDRRPCS